LRSRNAQLERYRFIVGSVADYVIFTLDAEGRIDSWSDSARNVLGYNAEEALGHEYSMVFTPAETEAGEPRREMEEAARTGHCTTESWRVRRDGALFWASGALTAVRDETGKLTGYIRVARDMTEQKRLEESLTKMAADLEIRVVERTGELEITIEELRRKNQEVEAFVYIVSHDLRAPLVNVQGFVRELDESRKRLKEVLQTCPQWEFCWPGISPILNEEMGGALHYISASAAKFEG
jgi:PAS domain S-box-containing protein